MSILHRSLHFAFPMALLLALPFGCDESSSGSKDFPADAQPVYEVAEGCYAISIDGSGKWLASAGERFSLEADSPEAASHFLFHPADLGAYLLYDNASQYLTSDGVQLLRQIALKSDTTRGEGGKIVINDTMISEGEWTLWARAEEDRFWIKHRASGLFVTEAGGLGEREKAASVALSPQSGCAVFPELELNASGTIDRTTFADGDVYGFVDSHEHLFTNYAFGGGAFHGSVFHRLGVEHALGDCSLSHGAGGRRDVLGFAFGDVSGGNLTDLLPVISGGELPFDTHTTDGYPTFSTWPAAPFSPTHQMMYYKWIERAYLAGLRLMVQHATTNQVLCEMVTGVDLQPKRHDCNDMVNVDRILDETYALERYIDALHGGPGRGWFRIVFSPTEAREVIREGKLAVVLGIETSDLFSCFAVPFGDFRPCTEADVVENLDRYQEKGVRVLFPVHKFDNGFSAGDGMRGFIAIGNLVHTGYWSNFVECPEDLLTFSGGFDKGGVSFAGMNHPREVYDSTPPLDMSGFAEEPVQTLLYGSPEVVQSLLNNTNLEGEYCQNHGLTPLGEFLMREMMKRGMIIDVAHFPRKSYKRAYEILIENDYPASDTHGRDFNGVLFQLGGISNSGFGRCRNGETAGAMDDGFQEKVQKIRANGGYPAQGFGFDLNGFAGAPGPRFGERSHCGQPQTDAGITYPFTSYAGDVAFEQPWVGHRKLDFNTEGMAHLGLVAELIQDVRLDGATDEDIEPLFRSAEGYIRMWEKAEARSAEIRGE